MTHEPFFFGTPKPRILIVDNDPKARVSYQMLLMYWGYDPVLAMGSGAALLEDAKRKAREKCCSLALIDLRLMDHYNKADVSGLTLAKELSDALRPIILSMYENNSVLKNMLEERQKDIIFISKEDDRDEMRKKLDAEAAKVSAAKRNLIFESPDILTELAESSLGKQAGEYSDQIADVFARLFPNATKLKFEKLEMRPDASKTSAAPRPNSIVLKVREDDYEPYVVKIARAEKIEKEVQNYNKYIFRRLTGGFIARLERSSILWDIGGATYSYVGNFDVKTFSRYYEEQPIADIEDCLKSFCRIWENHYTQAREETNVSLFKLYSKVWGSWYEKRIKDFAPVNSAEFDALGKKLNLPDPIQWFKKNVAESSADLSLVGATRIAVTHGDLHGDNLLVDDKRNVWVIDFERCGEGHILQDFIELEADIFNRLEASNEDFPAYFNMCLTILKQKNIQAFEKSETASPDARIEKALQTISILRALARQYTKVADAREYLFGLLFNMLFRAAMIHKLSPKKSQRALFFASLICHRLENWDEAWRPAEWNLS